MKLYRFSPITDEATIMAAFEHIYEELLRLRNAVFEEDWPVFTLKLFAHYEEEYEYLLEWINSIGVKDNASSSTSYYVKPNRPFLIAGKEIPYIGLRVPDPYRSQVGCGDYEVENYDEIKVNHQGRKGVREVEHPRYQMLELFDPNIDVLGYVVRKEQK